MLPYKNHLYSYNNMYLTNEQRGLYERNGYIVFRNLIDHDILDQAKQRFLDICDNKVPKKTMELMRDQYLKQNKNIKGEYLTNKIQYISYDDIFFKYVDYKPMVDIVESIIGPNITNFHSQIINKPPNSSIGTSKHPMHQDLPYFPFRPAHKMVISWTAMETINEKNGCLFVVPGSHTGAIYKHILWPGHASQAYHGVVGFDHLPTVNLIMEKGDTVFFHPLLLHGSGPNLTQGFRKAMSAHYADTNSTFVDLDVAIPECIRTTVFNYIISKGFNKNQIPNAWKIKSRLIRGEPGNFQQLDANL